MNVFICFAAEDRYKIAEPIAYNLKNYGINIWYDRLKLLLGDNRIQKNLIEGASQCKYAVLIVSSATNKSKCAMEEIAILKNRFIKNDITLFPVIYELKAENIPLKLKWIKN